MSTYTYVSDKGKMEKIDKTLDAIRQVMAIFKLERTVYLIMTIISVLVLLSIAIFLIINDQNKQTVIVVIGLFGSSGAISVSIGRLLSMWSKAMELLQNVIEDSNGDK